MHGAQRARDTHRGQFSLQTHPAFLWQLSRQIRPGLPLTPTLEGAALSCNGHTACKGPKRLVEPNPPVCKEEN